MGGCTESGFGSGFGSTVIGLAMDRSGGIFVFLARDFR